MSMRSRIGALAAGALFALFAPSIASGEDCSLPQAASLDVQWSRDGGSLIPVSASGERRLFYVEPETYSSSIAAQLTIQQLRMPGKLRQQGLEPPSFIDSQHLEELRFEA